MWIVWSVCSCFVWGEFCTFFQNLFLFLLLCAFKSTLYKFFITLEVIAVSALISIVGVLLAVKSRQQKSIWTHFPTWFFPDSSSNGTWKCGDGVHDTVRCNDSEKEASIFNCYTALRTANQLGQFLLLASTVSYIPNWKSNCVICCHLIFFLHLPQSCPSQDAC